MLRYLVFTARAHLRSPLGRWVRLGAAVLCVLFAGAAALGAVHRPGRTPAPPAAPVVVATRLLPAGARLHPDDLRVIRWPRALLPSAAASTTNGIVGRRLAGPVGGGEPITRFRLAGSALTAGLPPGTVATPVRLDADVRDLVRPGDRVDLIAGPPPAQPSRPRAGAADASVVASALPVLAVVAPRADDPFGGSGTQLVLATDRPTALRIATLQGSQTFAVVVDPP